MQRILLWLGVITLAGCTLNEPAPNDHKSHRVPYPTEITQNLGERVVQDLRKRYADTTPSCGVPARPSYECSGVLIRGTDHSPDYHVWNNSPTSHRKGAVSFAYLRDDAVFTGFNVSRTNGYIFHAYDSVDRGLKPEVLCAFPMDASSTLREGTGCGADPGYPASGPCQEQKIFSAEAWMKHVQGPDGYRAMCGFDVRLHLNSGAWQGFYENIRTRNLLPLEHQYGSNELRVAVWPDQDGSTLPLQAFFYFLRDSDPVTPREEARLNQQDLKATANVTVPVIAIRMPAAPGGDAMFEYRAEDQAIAIPEF